MPDLSLDLDGTLTQAHYQTTRILTTDPRALHHIVTRDDVYHKPEDARFSLARVLGDGVLVTEGEKHRQQVRVLLLSAVKQYASRAPGPRSERLW